MTQPMNILVSNDDGVFAPGLAALATQLSKVANVQVVAPDRNLSAASHSLTLNRPVYVKTLNNDYVSVEGTPTDCVHLAITGLLETRMDMVVSGINEGANLGDDVVYSGTVAAAMEGCCLGLPAMALSLASEQCQHYESAALVAKHFLEHFGDYPLPEHTVLNINVPDVPWDDLEGFEVTRLGRRHNAEFTIPQVDPRGRKMYWIGPPGAEQDAGPGTDFYAINRNYVSVTPLHLDLTHYQSFTEVKAWLGKLDIA